MKIELTKREVSALKDYVGTAFAVLPVEEMATEEEAKKVEQVKSAIMKNMIQEEIEIDEYDMIYGLANACRLLLACKYDIRDILIDIDEAMTKDKIRPMTEEILKAVKKTVAKDMLMNKIKNKAYNIFCKMRFLVNAKNKTFKSDNVEIQEKRGARA